MMQGNESIHAAGVSIGVTVLDYWRWSGSDLMSNVSRGVLAEFLVARALDVTHAPRVEWTTYDLKTRTGVTVEVKSAAYAQAWPQRRPSDIRFDIEARKQVWNAATNEIRDLPVPQRLADVYVFCVLGSEDRTADDTDPRDLDQWAFYVISRAFLDRKRPRQKTIGLNALRSLMRRAPQQREAAEVRYLGLRAAIEAAGGGGRQRE